MSVEQSTQQFYEELMPRFQLLQEAFLSEASKQDQICLMQSKNNENKFVDCMVKKEKQISRQEKKMSFRMSYLNIYTKNCFSAALKDKKDYDKCKQSVRDLVDRYEREAVQAIAK